MTAESVLQAYYDAYTAPAAFDPKHPEDGTLSRKDDGLPPLPLNAEQTKAAAGMIEKGVRTAEMLNLILNRVRPGTDEAAQVKADFLGSVAAGKITVDGLGADEAFAHLGYMKGGHNIPVLISLLQNDETAARAAAVLSDLVLIHNFFDDVARLYEQGNKYAEMLLTSWARAEWYSNRRPLEDETEVVVFKIPDNIEASTDFLSHSKGGHTRTDIPKHGKHYFMNKEMLAELNALKEQNPDVPAALAADKIGTSSSRKSGMNNVEWNTGIENEDTRFQPDKKTRAIIFAGRTLGPIFGKTAKDMGSIIVRTDVDALNTGDRVKIVWREGKVYGRDGKVVCTFSEPDASDFEMLRAGGGTNFRMGKILTANAARVLGKTFALPYAVPNVKTEKRPMTAAQKIIARAAGLENAAPGMTVYARVDTVASQDTTGPMTVQELQGTLAAMKLAVPVFLQSQCHNAAMGFRTDAVVAANTRLADFVKDLGGIALNMGDGIIHSWLNEIVMPDTIVVGGDSHTRTPTALSFPQGSGGVAEAAATGVTEIVVPPSVLVVLKGRLNDGITVRDLVNYIPYKAQQIYGQGSNIFEGSIIEFKRIGKPFEMIDVFRLTNASAERSAAAAYFEQPAETTAVYLKTSSVPLLERLAGSPYDNRGALKHRLESMKKWLENPQTVSADDNAAYAYTLEIDLAEITEPYIACPHTPDNVRPLSELAGTKADFCFVGSCMSGERDFISFEHITRPAAKLAVETWMAPPTRMTGMKLEQKGVFKALADRGARIEVSGCSLCMGNQERVQGAKNVLTTSTRNFKARMGDEASVYLVSAELAAAAALSGRFPAAEEYFKAVKNG